MIIIKVLDEIGHNEALAFPVKEADFAKPADPWYLDLIYIRSEMRLGLGAKVAMPWDTRPFDLATLPQAGRCPDECSWGVGLPVLDEAPMCAVRCYDMANGAKSFDFLPQDLDVAGR